MSLDNPRKPAPRAGRQERRAGGHSRVIAGVFVSPIRIVFRVVSGDDADGPQGRDVMPFRFAEVRCPYCESADVLEGLSVPVEYLCARCEREFVVQTDRAVLVGANG